MGLKHLTLDNNIEPPDWTLQASSGAATVTSSSSLTITNLLPSLDKAHRVLYNDDNRLLDQLSTDPDELDDVTVQELLSFDEDHNGSMANSEDNNSGYHTNGSTDEPIDTDLESFLINGLEDYFGPKKAPTSVVGAAKSNIPKTSRELMRERRKKDEHNMIERRRRYHINDRIKELATLLPKKWREEIKLNKGTILKASVDYIQLLNRNQIRIRRIIEQTRIIKNENVTALKRLQEMENLLKLNGIPAPKKSSFISSAMCSVGESLHNYSVQSVGAASSGYEPPAKVARLSPTIAGGPWDHPQMQACPVVQQESEEFTAEKNIESPIIPLERNFGGDSDLFTTQTTFNFANIFLDC